MSYQALRFRIPMIPAAGTTPASPGHTVHGTATALVALPLSAVLRLDDAAVLLHLFEEARAGNVPPRLAP